MTRWCRYGVGVRGNGYVRWGITPSRRTMGERSRWKGWWWWRRRRRNARNERTAGWYAWLGADGRGRLRIVRSRVTVCPRGGVLPLRGGVVRPSVLRVGSRARYLLRRRCTGRPFRLEDCQLISGTWRATYVVHTTRGPRCRRAVRPHSIGRTRCGRCHHVRCRRCCRCRRYRRCPATGRTASRTRRTPADRRMRARISGGRLVRLPSSPAPTRTPGSSVAPGIVVAVRWRADGARTAVGSAARFAPVRRPVRHGRISPPQEPTA